MNDRNEVLKLLREIGVSKEGLTCFEKAVDELMEEIKEANNDLVHKNKHFVFKAIFKNDESGPDIKVDIEGLRTNEILSSIAIMLYELMDKDVIAPKDVSILAEVVTHQKNCDDNE